MTLESEPFADSALAPFWGSSSGDLPVPILTAVGVGQHPTHGVAVSGCLPLGPGWEPEECPQGVAARRVRACRGWIWRMAG